MNKILGILSKTMDPCVREPRMRHRPDVQCPVFLADGGMFGKGQAERCLFLRGLLLKMTGLVPTPLLALTHRSTVAVKKECP